MVILRKAAKSYGYGRTELIPIKSAEGVGHYLAGYISKGISGRDPRDKGAHLWSCSKGLKGGTTQFQFNGSREKWWRNQVAKFAQVIQASCPDRLVCSMEHLDEVLGVGWMYRNRDYIAWL